MAAFEGARIEVHEEAWSDEEADPPVLGLTIACWGRASDGTWLTGSDALAPVAADDVDLLVENDGTLVGVSDGGWDALTGALAAAFPGAELRLYPAGTYEDWLAEPGELDTDGVDPVFSVDFTTPWKEQ
ncbi:MAG TPA: hypothetical protein VGF17_14850 [Phytomonospora sp.]